MNFLTGKKKLLLVLIILVILIGGFFYFRNKIYFSHGSAKENKIFEIAKGDGNAQIAANLRDEGLISGKVYFWLYLKTHGLTSKIYPGEYLLNGNLTIPEIAVIITNPQKGYERVLFKEGWTAKQVAEELTTHGFNGDAFLDLVNNPTKEIVSQFSALSGKPSGASLEGYLFPDTYYFSKEATPEGILKKILNNTESKINSDIRQAVRDQHKSLFEILTMASIVEKEVSNDEDRAIVSGIFWNRIKNGQPLQSDATLTYILNDKNGQHTLEQTKINSPYNTYVSKGLPSGPISNPGLSAIIAAIHPKDTDYNYFLSTKDGQTIFAKSFAEQSANKARYGL